LEGISVNGKAPDDQDKKRQAEERNDGINDRLEALWQYRQKKFNTDVSTAKQRVGSGKRNGYQLPEHDYVERTINRCAKQLAAKNIKAGNHHHHQESAQANQFKPSAQPAVYTVHLFQKSHKVRSALVITFFKLKSGLPDDGPCYSSDFGYGYYRDRVRKRPVSAKLPAAQKD
jgi:hypothetical protein